MIDSYTYKLELLDTRRLYSNIPISLRQPTAPDPFLSQAEITAPLPPMIFPRGNTDEEGWKVKKMLVFRHQGRWNKLKYLVHWENNVADWLDPRELRRSTKR